MWEYSKKTYRKDEREMESENGKVAGAKASVGLWFSI